MEGCRQFTKPESFQHGVYRLGKQMNLGFVESFLVRLIYLLVGWWLLAMGFAGEAFREQPKNWFNKHPVSKLIFDNMENASLQEMINESHSAAAGGGF